MCGIIAVNGSKNAAEVLVRGLQRLEYRGYDSVGIAVQTRGKTEILKSEGRVSRIEASVQALPESQLGLGHTRWATHGKPTAENAHPHQCGPVALVHNGIIENYLEIREKLKAQGYQPKSETDSELFGFLVWNELKAGRSFTDSVRVAFAQIEGACSIVLMSETSPDVLIGVRRGSPLIAAWTSRAGSMIASDVQALLDQTSDVFYLEHEDMVIATPKGLEFRSLKSGEIQRRESTNIPWNTEALDKQGYEHFMLKEIREQPTAFVNTFHGLIEKAASSFDLDPELSQALRQATRMTILACGSSYNAALLGRYWLQELGQLPTQVEIASEYRYASLKPAPGELVLGISQSGETADTLAALREVRASSQAKTIGLTNVRGSSICREAEIISFTHAGPEIGVAATKSFLTQVLSLLIWSLYRKGKDHSELDALRKIPHLLGDFLQSLDLVSVAEKIQHSHGFFFMGRGYSYPLALEGALKLKEIAYVHAEGYAAGELKHGPIAMLDPHMTVVAIVPKDRWWEKSISNLEEVRARGARIVGVGAESDSRGKSLCDFWIGIPECNSVFQSFFIAPVLQLLAYEVARLRGTDIDKPRNLAKSVTVE